jgi:hypothetical protein
MAVSAFYIPAQTTTTNTTTNTPGAFDTSGLPPWVKDLRRWEIVAFGSFPFTMFFTTFGMDMYRWSNANGMDMSEDGRRYAPWPLKSAGADVMDSGEFEKVLKIAACLSVGIAFTDLIIVQVKRYKARKKAEALPSGTIIIDRKPRHEEAPVDQDNKNADQNAADAGPVPKQP